MDDTELDSTDDTAVKTFSRRRVGKSRRSGSQLDADGLSQPKESVGGRLAGLVPSCVSSDAARSEIQGTKTLQCGETVALTKKNNKRKKMTQMFLDVGQRNFFSTQCTLCGFVYTPGNREEERLHDAHHREKLHLEALKVKTIPSGAKLMSRDEQGAIYKVHYSSERTDVSGIKAVVDRICTMVEGEMGTVNGWAARNDAIVFMCVNSRKEVIGCVILEANPMLAQIAYFTGVKSNKGIVLKRNEENGRKKKCQCAVRLMWTFGAYVEKGSLQNY
eukprot:jgi/Picre1/30533/NNA_005896.t1